MIAHSPCIIIPNCNHADGFARLVDNLLGNELPVIVINDGSDAATTNTLQEIAASRLDVELISFADNQGKGAAVMAGLRRARERGFTHALQIDADGQHNPNDVQKFLVVSRAQPSVLICGRPVFDASVPTHRLLFRYLTHVLVWLETLSFTIADSMCGLRIYPLDAICSLLEKHHVGKRMDFDIEILVKAYWEGLPSIFLPTRVIYPEQGLSNFRLWEDNWLISKMHARLLGGMLMRFPGLLMRRRPGPANAHWASIAERGSSAGLSLMLWIYRHLGRWVLLLLLHPVILYFVLFGRTARLASQQYWLQVARANGEEATVGFSTVYKHFYQFGVAAVDKVGSWTGAIQRRDAIIHGEEHFNKLIATRQGALFIGSHLGNLELCRALGEKGGRFRINAIVFHKNALKFQQVLRACAPQVELNVIQVDSIGIDTAIVVKQKIDAGEIIIIVGDRTSVSATGRVFMADFLGKPAPFAEGPFVLASILECPVYLIFCLREQGTYNVYLEPFAQSLKFPRAERVAQLAGKVQQYAQRLEHHTLRVPDQWFNFHDFWQVAPPPAAPTVSVANPGQPRKQQ